ncbi:hypothetical protein DFJ73DRAFT_962748 [Zopfochytrium polystomum]|nr:hypothetical protein DFJ73DRAFT_962748 [Zopfochytrium polystomum]
MAADDGSLPSSISPLPRAITAHYLLPPARLSASHSSNPMNAATTSVATTSVATAERDPSAPTPTHPQSRDGHFTPTTAATDATRSARRLLALLIAPSAAPDRPRVRGDTQGGGGPGCAHQPEGVRGTLVRRHSDRGSAAAAATTPQPLPPSLSPERAPQQEGQQHSAVEAEAEEEEAEDDRSSPGEPRPGWRAGWAFFAAFPDVRDEDVIDVRVGKDPANRRFVRMTSSGLPKRLRDAHSQPWYLSGWFTSAIIFAVIAAVSGAFAALISLFRPPRPTIPLYPITEFDYDSLQETFTSFQLDTTGRHLYQFLAETGTSNLTLRQVDLTALSSPVGPSTRFPATVIRGCPFAPYQVVVGDMLVWLANGTALQLCNISATAVTDTTAGSTRTTLTVPLPRLERGSPLIAVQPAEAGGANLTVFVASAAPALALMQYLVTPTTATLVDAFNLSTASAEAASASPDTLRIAPILPLPASADAATANLVTVATWSAAAAVALDTFQFVPRTGRPHTTTAAPAPWPAYPSYASFPAAAAASSSAATVSSSSSSSSSSPCPPAVLAPPFLLVRHPKARGLAAVLLSQTDPSVAAAAVPLTDPAVHRAALPGEEPLSSSSSSSSSFPSTPPEVGCLRGSPDARVLAVQFRVAADGPATMALLQLDTAAADAAEAVAPRRADEWPMGAGDGDAVADWPVLGLNGGASGVWGVVETETVRSGGGGASLFVVEF